MTNQLSEDRVEPTLAREVHRRAALAGVPDEVVRPYVEDEVAKHPIRIRYGTPPGEQFSDTDLARVVQVGTQLTLWLNIRHPFVYRFLLGDEAGHDAAWDEEDEEGRPLLTSRQRSQFEVFLAVICGLEPDADREQYVRLLNDLGKRLYYGSHILADLFEVDGTPPWHKR